jgi:hypothetical protein
MRAVFDAGHAPFTPHLLYPQVLSESPKDLAAAFAANYAFLDVCDRILGKCLCPLGDAAAMPVASYVDKFRAEFQEHLDSGCPMRGSSSLEGILAPTSASHFEPSATIASMHPERMHVRSASRAGRSLLSACPGRISSCALW